MTDAATVRKNFTDQEVQEYKKHFGAFDQNGDGHIDVKELDTLVRNLGERATLDELSKMIEEVDSNGTGTIEFEEFLMVMAKVRSGDATSSFSQITKKAQVLVVQGASGVHSFAEEERDAFATHINQTLGNDPDLGYLLPIDPNSMELFTKCRDGVLLSKLINKAVPGTIDERALNIKGANINMFQITENQNLCINSAKAIGCSVVNIGPNDLIEGKPHLVLGLIWQIVKIQLLSAISLQNFPELIRLLEEGEELSDLLKLPPDQLLLRWFNFHLKNANHPRRVKNFGGDIKDSENYLVLLNQIAPDRCDLSAKNQPDLTQRATAVLNNSKTLGVEAFIKPSDIVNGNQRLNLAFCASIFNTCPGLDPPTEEEKYLAAEMMTDDEGDSREERAFRMWINSLGIETYVNNLFEDLRDGIVILQVMDFVEPGIVAWSRVNMKCNNKYKKVENCNYAVVLAKQLRFSLVGVGGVDIVDGNKKLTLALIWQLMRFHTIKFLKELKFQGKEVTDGEIISWANNKVSSAGKSSNMSSFHDPSLKTGVFLLDLLSAVEPRAVNWDFVTPGATDDDAQQNAKYAVSVARKLGCTIFLLWEDIVEVKPKMILTFVAAIMAVAK